jgi:hypothetical protein
MLSIFQNIKNLWTAPAKVRDILLLVFMLIVMIIFAFPSESVDWALNAEPIQNGLSVYENPNYVYPPWSLLLFWPYYLLHGIGTRIAYVLVAAFLVYRLKWSLSDFLAIALSPSFLFSVNLTNSDLFVLSLPILLWHYVSPRKWAAFVWGLLLSFMLLKPQASLFIILYLLWRERSRPRELLLAFLISALITLPISLIGSPPLLLQWLQNILYPSPNNTDFWDWNNLSLSRQFGFFRAFLLIGGAYSLLYWLMRWRGKSWMLHHSWATALFSCIFLAPYASLQTIVGAFIFVPSWLGNILVYILILVSRLIFKQIYIVDIMEGSNLPFWLFFFSLIYLWFAPSETAKITGQAEVGVEKVV